MGWEVLEQWGDDAVRIEPLAGGVANDVWSVRVNGRLAVGRLGVRSDADLAWETELLKRLDREGLTVPVPIPTTDGRLFADGLVVMTYMEGAPPETKTAGILRRMAAISMPGVILSQLEMQTMASAQWALTIYSTASAMISRLGSE